MVWVSAAVAKKHGITALKAGNVATKTYKKYHKKRGSSYRKRQAFYVDRGYSYDPPSVVGQDNTMIILVAGVVGYFLLKQAGETATEAAIDAAEEVYTSAVDKFKEATSSENVQEAGFSFASHLIDYQKWMMGMVFDVEKGAASAIVDSGKDLYTDAVRRSDELEARVDAKIDDYKADLNDSLSSIRDYLDGVKDRATADRSGSTPVSVYTGPNADSSKYTTPSCHQSDLSGGGSLPSSSSSSSSSSRYSSTGRYLGEKASWMK